MELLTLPLAFGNVTLATLTIVITLAVLALVVEVGIWIIKKTLALDTDDAPDVKLKNPIYKLLNELPLTKIVNNIRKVDNEYAIKSDPNNKHSSSCWERNGSGTWSSTWYLKKYCTFKTKDECKLHEMYEETTVTSFQFLFLGFLVVLGVDFIVLLLQYSFMPTLCISLTFTSMFCIRTLAKKFYKGMKKHSDRLDGHDKSIDELKSK